jgi:Zinc finger, C3HC4 type (RING finger)
VGGGGGTMGMALAAVVAAARALGEDVTSSTPWTGRLRERERASATLRQAVETERVVRRVVFLEGEREGAAELQGAVAEAGRAALATHSAWVLLQSAPDGRSPYARGTPAGIAESLAGWTALQTRGGEQEGGEDEEEGTVQAAGAVVLLGALARSAARAVRVAYIAAQDAMAREGADWEGAGAGAGAGEDEGEGAGAEGGAVRTQFVESAEQIRRDEVDERGDEDGDDRKTCPVCLAHRRAPSALACGHVLCWTCALECARRQKKCPLCRRLIAPQDIVPLQEY